MKKFVRYCVLCTVVLGLSACATTGGGMSVQQAQSAITNASMVGEGADCNVLAQNIQAMDQVIVSSGHSNAGYNSYGNGATSAINNSLYRSGALSKNPALGAIPGLMNSWSGMASSSPNYAKQQQAGQANAQKNRLIYLFQQQRCVRVN